MKGSGAEALPLGGRAGLSPDVEAEAHRVTRPVGWAEAGFYAMRMPRAAAGRNC